MPMTSNPDSPIPASTILIILMGATSGAPDRLGVNRSNTRELNHHFNLREIPAQPPMRLKLMQYQAFGDALGLSAALIEFARQGLA